MKHPTTWILVADSARARFFVNKGPGTGLDTALDYQPHGLHLKSSELGSDKPGRGFSSRDGRHHSMEPPTDLKEVVETRFFRQIAGILNDQHNHGAFERLIVVAPPTALGRLRKAMPEGVRATVVAELDKDLTKCAAHDLPAHLGSAIRL